MKAQYALIGLFVTSVAHSADFGLYANAVAAHNIAAAQHAISNKVFSPMGKTSRVQPARAPAATQPATNEPAAPAPDGYGEMIYYGEFGDDTGVLPLVTGRSGGDAAANDFLRVDWQHFSDTVKHKSHQSAKSTSDLVYIGYGQEFNASRLEFFGGYTGDHTKNNALDLDTDGAFIGASFGKRIQDVEIAAMADFGFALNDVTTTTYGGDLNNFYFGFMANVAYDYMFYDNAFLRPGFRAGYTLVNSANYISTAGDNITNKNFGFFELTPMVDIIGNLGGGFSIGAHAGYVINLATGGRTYVNYAAIPKLSTDDYFEYGINISQTFDGFSLDINFGRHDGDRSGWNGGAEFKYVF